MDDVTNSLLTKEIPYQLTAENVEGSKMLDDINVSSTIPVKEESGGTLSVSFNGDPTQLTDHSSSQEGIQVNIILLIFCFINCTFLVKQ